MFTPLSSPALRCIFRIKRLHLALDLACFCRRWNSTYFMQGKISHHGVIFQELRRQGRARPSDLIRLECPLTRIFASIETLNSASVNGLLTQLNGSLAHKCAPGTDVEDLQSFLFWFLSTVPMACGHLLDFHLGRGANNQNGNLRWFFPWRLFLGS